MARRNAKRDGNHADIVRELRKVGAHPVDLAAAGDGVPDLAVLFRGSTHWLELKADERQRNRKGRTATRQLEFKERAQSHGVHVYTVTSVEEALAAIGAVKWSTSS